VKARFGSLAVLATWSIACSSDTIHANGAGGVANGGAFPSGGTPGTSGGTSSSGGTTFTGGTTSVTGGASSGGLAATGGSGAILDASVEGGLADGSVDARADDATTPDAAPTGCTFTGQDVPSRELDILYMHGTQDGLVDFANAVTLRDAVIAHYHLDAGTKVAGDGTFTRTRYTAPEGHVFEFIQHDYVSDSAVGIPRLGVAIKGHCFPRQSGSDHHAARSAHGVRLQAAHQLRLG
jgi:hypothetical protein